MTSKIAHPDTTLCPPAENIAVSRPATLALTLAAHPVLRRIGERCRLTELAEGRRVDLSRLTPEFRTCDDRPTGPIDEPHVSRSPVQLVPHADGGVTLIPPTRGASTVLVDGTPLLGPLECASEALRRGVVIGFAGQVLVLLHAHSATGESLPKLGLVGESAALHQVRAEIRRASALSVPVLIRGESGTGKELIARALHAASPRAARPYVALNMAALNPQTAMAELFGHARGSFTGAVQEREGYFREADGGTIFLDEIGEAPIEVQVMLLRVLECGEVQPVGGRPGRRVDVRLLAATDTNLEKAVMNGDFRISLLHRLAGFELHVPPLRQRCDDIPRLLLHFLEHELRRAGRSTRLEDLDGETGRLLPARVVAELLRHDWPGNVRELSNVARRMLGGLLAGDAVTSIATLIGGADARAGEGRTAAASEPRAAEAVPPRGELSEDTVMEALQTHEWQISATARALGVSRKSLYKRIAKSEHMRKARDLSSDELAAALTRYGGLRESAEALKVSIRALQLRAHELKLLP